MQRRLPNDIVRFGIKDYDQLNEWFNTFYISYINKKFAFVPLDPNDAFVPIGNTDLSQIFTIKQDRTIKEDMFSLNNGYYCLIDEKEKRVHIINGTIITVCMDVFTGVLTVRRYGKVYNTLLVSSRKRSPANIANNQKELQEFLNSMKK